MFLVLKLAVGVAMVGVTNLGVLGTMSAPNHLAAVCSGTVTGLGTAVGVLLPVVLRPREL